MSLTELEIKDELLQKHCDYMEKYDRIVVTYHDNKKKSFKPYEWAIFENKVTPLAKHIEWVPINTKLKIHFSWKKLWLQLLILLLCCVSISTLVQAFLCPDMTHTELFIRIPNSVVMDWVECP